MGTLPWLVLVGGWSEGERSARHDLALETLVTQTATDTWREWLVGAGYDEVRLRVDRLSVTKTTRTRRAGRTLHAHLTRRPVSNEPSAAAAAAIQDLQTVVDCLRAQAGAGISPSLPSGQALTRILEASAADDAAWLARVRRFVEGVSDRLGEESRWILEDQLDDWYAEAGYFPDFRSMLAAAFNRDDVVLTADESQAFRQLFAPD